MKNRILNWSGPSSKELSERERIAAEAEARVARRARAREKKSREFGDGLDDYRRARAQAKRDRKTRA